METDISLAFGVFVVSLLTVGLVLYTLYRSRVVELQLQSLGNELAVRKSAETQLSQYYNDVILQTTTKHKAEIEKLSRPESKEPFVVFPCPCGVELQLVETLEPGQAAVINCENCGTSHSVYLPPIQIKPTEQFELVWPFTSKEGTAAAHSI